MVPLLKVLPFDWLRGKCINALFCCFFFSFFLITFPPWKQFVNFYSTPKTLHVLSKTGNHTGTIHLQHRNKPLCHHQTGNRRLEIYCNGLGSLVLVAVYIGMHNGHGWNYSESSIALWYERTYWCEAFRNSKIYNLVLERINVLIKSI